MLGLLLWRRGLTTRVGSLQLPWAGSREHRLLWAWVLLWRHCWAAVSCSWRGKHENIGSGGEDRGGKGKLLGCTAVCLPTTMSIRPMVALQGMEMAVLLRQRRVLMMRAVESPSQASQAVSLVQVSPGCSADHPPQAALHCTS